MLRLEHVHHYIPGTDSVPVVYSGSGRLLTDFLPVPVRGRPVCKLQYSPMVHHGNLVGRYFTGRPKSTFLKKSINIDETLKNARESS
nr:unnamed protein product [Callosobruchus chinensis]